MIAAAPRLTTRRQQPFPPRRSLESLARRLDLLPNDPERAGVVRLLRRDFGHLERARQLSDTPGWHSQYCALEFRIRREELR